MQRSMRVGTSSSRRWLLLLATGFIIGGPYPALTFLMHQPTTGRPMKTALHVDNNAFSSFVAETSADLRLVGPLAVTCLASLAIGQNALKQRYKLKTQLIEQTKYLEDINKDIKNLSNVATMFERVKKLAEEPMNNVKSFLDIKEPVKVIAPPPPPIVEKKEVQWYKALADQPVLEKSVQAWALAAATAGAGLLAVKQRLEETQKKLTNNPRNGTDLEPEVPFFFADIDASSLYFVDIVEQGKPEVKGKSRLSAAKEGKVSTREKEEQEFRGKSKSSTKKEGKLSTREKQARQFKEESKSFKAKEEKVSTGKGYVDVLESDVQLPVASWKDQMDVTNLVKKAANEPFTLETPLELSEEKYSSDTRPTTSNDLLEKSAIFVKSFTGALLQSFAQGLKKEPIVTAEEVTTDGEPIAKENTPSGKRTKLEKSDNLMDTLNFEKKYKGGAVKSTASEKLTEPMRAREQIPDDMTEKGADSKGQLFGLFDALSGVFGQFPKVEKKPQFSIPVPTVDKLEEDKPEVPAPDSATDAVSEKLSSLAPVELKEAARTVGKSLAAVSEKVPGAVVQSAVFLGAFTSAFMKSLGEELLTEKVRPAVEDATPWRQRKFKSSVEPAASITPTSMGTEEQSSKPLSDSKEYRSEENVGLAAVATNLDQEKKVDDIVENVEMSSRSISSENIELSESEVATTNSMMTESYASKEVPIMGLETTLGSSIESVIPDIESDFADELSTDDGVSDAGDDYFMTDAFLDEIDDSSSTESISASFDSYLDALSKDQASNGKERADKPAVWSTRTSSFRTSTPIPGFGSYLSSLSTMSADVVTETSDEAKTQEKPISDSFADSAAFEVPVDSVTAVASGLESFSTGLLPGARNDYEETEVTAATMFGSEGNPVIVQDSSSSNNLRMSVEDSTARIDESTRSESSSYLESQSDVENSHGLQDQSLVAPNSFPLSPSPNLSSMEKGFKSYLESLSKVPADEESIDTDSLVTEESTSRLAPIPSSGGAQPGLSYLESLSLNTQQVLNPDLASNEWTDITDEAPFESVEESYGEDLGFAARRGGLVPGLSYIETLTRAAQESQFSSSLIGNADSEPSIPSEWSGVSDVKNQISDNGWTENSADIIDSTSLRDGLVPELSIELDANTVSEPNSPSEWTGPVGEPGRTQDIALNPDSFPTRSGIVPGLSYVESLSMKSLQENGMRSGSSDENAVGGSASSYDWARSQETQADKETSTPWSLSPYPGTNGKAEEVGATLGVPFSGMNGKASADMNGKASADMNGKASADMNGNASDMNGKASADMNGKASADMNGKAAKEGPTLDAPLSGMNGKTEKEETTLDALQDNWRGYSESAFRQSPTGSYLDMLNSKVPPT